MSGDQPKIPSDHPQMLLQGKNVGVLVSDWHRIVTDRLVSEATKCLRAEGIRNFLERIPGCFELPLAAQILAKRPDIDAIVALGCVVQGETPHFSYVCRACCDGLLKTSLKYAKPVGFGIITANNMEQALARSKAVGGNKGREAAIAVVKMLLLAKKYKTST